MNSPGGKIVGYYKERGDRRARVIRVTEDKFLITEGGRKENEEYRIEVTYGQLKPAEKVLSDHTGVQNYNFKITIFFPDEKSKKIHEKIIFGILMDEGDNVFIIKDSGDGVDHLQRISEEDAKDIESDLGDPISRPPGPYKVQPERQGRFLWLTGAPGLGKSTTAQLLGREKGYVYYEEDCFIHLRNPYIPLEVDNPTMQQEYQRNLTGEGRDQREEKCKIVWKALEKLLRRKKLSKAEQEDFDQYYEMLCSDLSRERERIGGDWAVAGVIITKHHRDIIRKLLGPDLVIVILTMKDKNTKKRLKKRHKKDDGSFIEILMAIGGLTEKISKDEENVVTVNIEEGMTKEEIMNLVLARTDGDLPLKEEPSNVFSNFCCII